MERFLSDVEAAQMLKIPVSELSTMEIHKCPYGYSIDVLEEFISINNLPIQENIYHVIVIGEESHPEENLVWCNNIQEALFRANSRTRAIISKTTFSKDVYDLAITYGIKLLLIGEDQEEWCHLSCASLEDAVDRSSTI